MRLAGKRIILGVTGSIAAYKSVLLLRHLQKLGAEVRVGMTPNAVRFVTPLTFSALAHYPVFTDAWDQAGNWSEHVQWGQWADGMVVAPCTANTLAKLAHGNADDAVSILALSLRAPLLVAPTMDLEMYKHAATQANLAVLRARGVQVVEPESGYLASGLDGQGRLPEPEALVEAVEAMLATQALAGVQVLVSAGPTQEALDPVRYLSNHSTGKMGVALTRALLQRGASVTLVMGPTHQTLPRHPKLKLIPVVTALEMHAAMLAQQPLHGAIIKASAVADFRPIHEAGQKIKKKPGQRYYNLELETTDDILAALGQHKPEGQLLVGFALETQDEVSNALKKLEKKNLDCIVMNSLNDAGAGFGHDTNRVMLLSADGTRHTTELKSKDEIAQEIIAHLMAHHGLAARKNSK